MSTQKRSRDPLIHATKKAYNSTPLSEVDKLLAQEQRWRRKLTIAQNKLETVQHVIRVKLKELATPKAE